MDASEDAVIEFSGGPYDGHTVDTRSADHLTATLAQFVYMASEGGQIGKIVQGYSPAGLEAIAAESYRGEANDRGFSFNHHYRVTGRTSRDGRMVISMEYITGE
jgi:hypothetical protein